MRYKAQRDRMVKRSWWCRRNPGAANRVHRLLWDHFRWIAAGSRMDDPEEAVRQEAEKAILFSDKRDKLVDEIRDIFKENYGQDYGSAVLLIILKVVVPILVDLFLRWLLDESEATTTVMECHSCS